MTGSELESAVRRLVGDPDGVKYGVWAAAPTPNVVVSILEQAVGRLCEILPFSALGKCVSRLVINMAVPVVGRPAGNRFGSFASMLETGGANPAYPCEYIRMPPNQLKEENLFIKSTQKTPTIYETGKPTGAFQWLHYPVPVVAPDDYDVFYDVVTIPITGSGDELSAAAWHIAEYASFPGELHELLTQVAAYYLLKGNEEDEIAAMVLKTEILPRLQLYGIRRLSDDSR